MFLFSDSEEENKSKESNSLSNDSEDSLTGSISSLSQEIQEFPTDSEMSSTSSIQSEKDIKSKPQDSSKVISSQNENFLKKMKVFPEMSEEDEIIFMLNMDKNISEIDDLMVRYLKHDQDIYQDGQFHNSEMMFRGNSQSIMSYKSDRKRKKLTLMQTGYKKYHNRSKSILIKKSLDSKISKDKALFEINKILDDWDTLALDGERIFKKNSKISRGLVAMAVPHPTVEEESDVDCLAMSNLKGKLLFFDLKNDKKMWIDVANQNQNCKKFGLRNDFVTVMKFSCDNKMLFCGFMSGSLILFKVTNIDKRFMLEEYKSIDYDKLSKNPISNIYISHTNPNKFLIKDFYNNVMECQYADFLFYTNKVKKVNFCKFNHSFIDVVEVQLKDKTSDFIFLSIDENSNLNFGSFSQQKLFQQTLFAYGVHEVISIDFNRRFYKSFSNINVVVLIKTKILLFKVFMKEVFNKEFKLEKVNFKLSNSKLIEIDFVNIQINSWLTESIYMVKETHSDQLYLMNFPDIDEEESKDSYKTGIPIRR
jgi:hypothetical protein